MKSFLSIFLGTAGIVFTGFPGSLPATHTPGHQQAPGQQDPYNCTVLVEQTDGTLEEEQLGKIDCILHKLDRIERRMGCPLEDYLRGDCPYTPADTTATFCISQGREGGIDAEFGAEANADIDLGVGWPNAAWAKAIGNLEVPVVIPPFLPVPTELNLTGAASLGRNFDICLEVPLEAAMEPGPLELVSDAAIIDEIVRAINEPQLFTKSKFQRRLGRLANYAIFRVPGTNRFELRQAQAHESELARILGDDGESEFDFVEDALERLMAGDLGAFGEGGPLEILKSPVVQDLSMVLELPAPVTMVFSDPDIVIGRIFELSGIGNEGGFSPNSESPLLGIDVCNRFGLNTDLRTRFPQVAGFCDLLSGLPAFAKTTGIFSVVDVIRSIVDALPTLEDIMAASCEIAGWLCPEN